MKENNKITLKKQEYNLIIKTNSADSTSKHNAETYKRQKFRGVQNKLKVVELLGGCCQECGYKENLAALEFHHRDPNTKLFNLDARNLSNLKWSSVTEEAAKCKLLCANCHRVEHNPDLFMRDLMNPLITTEFIPDKEIKGYFVRIQHKNPIKNCPECGTKLGCRKAKLCVPCSKKNQAAKSKKIPKQVLEKLIWEYPFTVLGQQLGVSDNAVRKWCKSYGITNLPKAGYFLTKDFKTNKKYPGQDSNL